jgi:hypothetical protein
MKGQFTFGDNIPGEPERGHQLLTVELVPKPLWHKNLRSDLSRADWDRLRKMAYRRAGYKCEVCGGTGLEQEFNWPVECHEVWHYDDERHIQRLDRLIALCPWCHHVKHMGRISATEGEAGVARCMTHLKTVNDWTESQVTQHVGEVSALWQLRSGHADWIQDLSVLESGSY